MRKHGGEGSLGVVTALYKVNLHCIQCAREIEKPILRTQGVQMVHVDFEGSEIKVKGQMDPNKIQDQITRISKKKVEMVILPGNVNDGISASSKEKGEEKIKVEPLSKITTLKVHLHCIKCEEELTRKILKRKGVYSVKSDSKAQTLTIEGTIEPQKLVKYIQQKVHKHAEIIEKKEKVKGVDVKIAESKKINEGEDKKENVKETNVKVIQSKKVMEEEKEKMGKVRQFEPNNKFVEGWEDNQIEMKYMKESNAVPYIVYYGYAPQLFSDENPNACLIM